MKPIRNTQSRTQDLQQETSIERSIRDYRNAFPKLTDQQIAKRYELRYGVRASRVLYTLAKQNQPTGGGVA